MDIKAGKKFLKEKNYIEAEKIFLNLIKLQIFFKVLALLKREMRPTKSIHS